MRILFSFLMLLFSISAFADAGFKNGNTIQVWEVFGNARIECRTPYGRPYVNYYNCHGQVMNPDGFDSFVMNPTVDADNVQLSCLQANGRTVNQSSRFNAKTGESSDRFDLLVSTVFQTPLLSTGTNKVSYALTKAGQPVANGDFQVDVQYLGQRRCFDGMIYDGSGFYCNNIQEACGEYFREQNWCQ